MSMLLCPVCSIPLGELDPAGRLDAVCATCCYQFRILKPVFVVSASRTAGFQLQLTLPEGPRHTVYHWSRNLHRWARSRTGLSMGSVVTVRHGNVDDVIWLWSHGEPAIRVGSAGQRARRTALIGATSLVLVVVLLGGLTVTALLSAVAAGIAAFWGIGRLRTARQRIDPV